jgi:hypothetical protein
MFHRPLLRLFWAILLSTLAGSEARAWETDQMYGRSNALPDAAEALDNRMDAALGRAVARVVDKGGCSLDDAELRFALADAIHHEVGPPRLVQGRNLLQAKGYNAYGAWVEQSGLGLLPGRDQGLYAEVGPFEGMLLATTGTCSTVDVAGVRVGVDKFDHFLGMGHALFTRSFWPQGLEAALEWSARTEVGHYGLAMSGAFSYADLEANAEGYAFYAGLLSPDSMIVRGQGSCPVQVRPWSWAEVVDWRYDEVMNPPVYTVAVAGAVRERLEADPEFACAGYDSLGGASYAEHITRLMALDDPLARGKAPPRVDPFGLATICGASPLLDEGPIAADLRPSDAPEPSDAPDGPAEVSERKHKATRPL